MKALLPVPDWWFFLVEGQRTPWDSTAVYSDVFIFALAFQCYLERTPGKQPTAENVLATITRCLPTDEDAIEKDSLATIVLLKWAELVDYFSELGDNLTILNVEIERVQPFNDCILVDVPKDCVSKAEVGRFINLRKPPIDMQ